MSLRLLVPAALIAACLCATPSASGAGPTPAVIPALPSWAGSGGTLQLSAATRIVVDHHDSAAVSTARTLATDLRALKHWPAPIVSSAHPGDIVLRRANRSDLGAEGYALSVGRQVDITGRTDAGLFYGTRTLLQMLAAGSSIPTGSTVDVPKYAERGIALCACYAYYTTAWIDRLVKDMAYLKLNYLHLEIKVRSSTFPEINTFSYYAPDEIRGIVALARKYHITVVPEINSPGHIDPYIENYPDLQLVDKNGVADPTRLDITKPAAFTFYTRLIEDYLKVFPGQYWHMGADEYMLGSAYANYPQLLAYARAKFGPNAVAQDAYVDFINRVDAYVRSKGRSLRIWNDGLTGDNTIPLNRDITVEYWTGETVTPQNLLDAGNAVMNATDSWYYVRGGYGPDSRSLYESDWSPVEFPGQTITAAQPGLTGSELAIWPDNYGKETENTAQQDLFYALRVFAQEAWGSPRPTADYSAFQTLADGIGHSPGWGPAWVQPIPAGTYVIPGLSSPGSAGNPLTAGGSDRWQLAATADGYYRLTSTVTGLCADMRSGTPNRLGVVEQEGAAVTAETCNGSTTQEWQLEPAPGGFRIVNAITQEAAVPGTTVVQQPRVVAPHAVWHIF